jgi:hypothetical protein
MSCLLIAGQLARLNESVSMRGSDIQAITISSAQLALKRYFTSAITLNTAAGALPKFCHLPAATCN